MASLAREAVEEAGDHAAERQVQVRLDAADGLSPVQGDAFLLRRLLANLLDNAVDFSPAGGVVDVALRREAGAVQVTVSDRGPGIPDYARERVFERFYSLPRPDGGARSSGLGLNFVAEIATLHGGTVHLEPRQGGGTCARVLLPAG